LLAYSGVNFFGMQRNPEMKTIEDELLKAMLKNEWINEEGFNQPQDLLFQRAARTDKGVSAVQQVVSMKLRELDQNISKMAETFNLFYIPQPILSI
jgi:tRNA pseudouridine38-40 synthase